MAIGVVAVHPLGTDRLVHGGVRYGSALFQSASEPLGRCDLTVDTCAWQTDASQVERSTALVNRMASRTLPD